MARVSRREPAARCDRLGKRYGTSVAVAGVSLDIAQGEMVVLLGPSGCGKTTTLRMVAGFVAATAGDILLDGAASCCACRRTGATWAWCSRATRCSRT